MNTNELKRFAREARIKLLDQVGRKLEYVITADTAELRGMSNQINDLRTQINKIGKEQVIEKVAYTWFNRLMALRFMDANGYNTPMVVTPLPEFLMPQVLQEAKAGNVEENLQLDRKRLNDLLDGKTQVADAQTEAYKLLLIASCNALNSVMPFMFERISDYTELLLPDDLLSDYSIITDVRNGMTEEDCKQEELIGWLYQFYIADKKDEVFSDLKKNVKITAENIPAATQLFTPRWIVRYMVENTLGKLWLTLKPSSKLKEHMPYYIEAPEGNEATPLPEGVKGVTDIKFLDPCQGSGHVLVYAFDLFTKIYEEEGYNTNEIPGLILENNLFGIDIDERAAQLAAFALTMKGRNYYARFLRKPVKINVIALENIDVETIEQTIKLPLVVDERMIYHHSELSLYNLTQAKNFGSLIQIDPHELKILTIEKGSIWEPQQEKLLIDATYLAKKYHCIVTNPPYMGSRNMNEFLKEFLQILYKNTKRDLFSAFIERCNYFSSINGLYSLINQHSWMFTNDFYEFRKQFIDNQQLISVLHLGAGLFDEISGEVVQSVSFVVQNTKPGDNKVIFYDCTDTRGSTAKEECFLNLAKPLAKQQSDFKELETISFAYWISTITSKVIKTSKCLADFSDIKVGLQTGNNELFLRRWYEVSRSKIDFQNQPGEISNLRWFPYNKGGGYQKFYGNNELVCDWENNGLRVKNNFDLNGKPRSVIRNSNYYFKEGISFNLTGAFSARYKDVGFLFDVQGSSLFPPKEAIYPIIALLNSKIVRPLLRITNPTLVTQVGDLKLLPVAFDFSDSRIPRLTQVAKNLTGLYKSYWDSNETSWDFEKLPFDIKKVKLEILFKSFSFQIEKSVEEIRILEEELNKLLIDLYGLNNEYSNSIAYEDLTLSNNKEIILKQDKVELDKIELTKTLISYTVGNMLGRFNVDLNGFVITDVNKSLNDYFKQFNQEVNYRPDEDNIIPVLDGEYFNDDIVGEFKEFIKATCGLENLNENIEYLEKTLGKDIRKYFVKDFYNDHIKRYKKRPIYWMFTSPKGHFKALIYMHRYRPNTISTMLNDYLRVYIGKLESEQQSLNQTSISESASAREQTIATKRIAEIEVMLKDLKIYERTLFDYAAKKIEIDLDDGVKVNYLKFKEILVPIKGLDKDEE